MPPTVSRPGGRTASAVAALAASAVLISGCASTASTAPAPSAAAPSGRGSVAVTGPAVFDASRVHSIALDLDPDDLAAVVQTYRATGDKEWVHAAVTIDGRTFADVGLRLKGNATLRDVDVDSDPAQVGWLIDLDHFVDGQVLDGYTRFAVRSDTNETALNEAVALDLLERAGLAGEHAVSTRFSVNGGSEVLRLVVQDLDDTWDEETFEGDGVLYKAEAGGDYSYRGEDPASYVDVFDQETDEDDEQMGPLIEFLRFLAEADDAEFAAELADHLDVASFATYLAFEQLVANRDDIEGGGNNSYLRYDEATGRFTVVAWDHNSAFGGGLGPGGRPGAGGPAGGRGAESSRTNVLVQRFSADAGFQALVDQAYIDLRASLYGSGAAQQVLDTWVDVLSGQAADVVDAGTIRSEAADVASYFPG